MTTELEEWRVVPSDPTIMASSLGRIKILPYQGKRRMYAGEPTYGCWAGNRFIFTRRGYKTRKVHRLVAEAFHGPCPDGMIVMHDDEDARNNKPSNLVYGTQKHNLNYPGFIEYCKNRGSRR